MEGRIVFFFSYTSFQLKFVINTFLRAQGRDKLQ